jgi:acyl dehydratase
MSDLRRDGDHIEDRIEAYLPHEDSPTIRNPIHSTEVARRFGFDRALVGGVTVWGWATPVIIEALGEAWLDRGWAAFAFRQPTYPGDAMTIVATPDADVPGAWSVTMTNHEGVDCVRATVGLGDGPWIDEFVTPVRTEGAAEPAPKPPLVLDEARTGEDWIPMANELSIDEAREFARDAQHSDDPRFVGAQPRIHPAWLAARAESVMRHNWAIPSSMHTRSRVQHLAPASPGGVITSSAHLLAAYERRGHHFVDFDVLIRADDGTDLVRLRHTTAFRIATPEERAAAGATQD